MTLPGTHRPVGAQVTATGEMEEALREEAVAHTSLLSYTLIKSGHMQ